MVLLRPMLCLMCMPPTIIVCAKQSIPIIILYPIIHISGGKTLVKWVQLGAYSSLGMYIHGRGL